VVVFLCGAGATTAESKSTQENSEAFLQITSGPAIDYFPTWSPDGRKLAFASDRDGSPDIWTIDVEMQLGTPPEGGS